MSYSSRVYRQRNAHTHDEGKQDSFFGKQSENDDHASKSIFQAKLAVHKPGDKYEKEADSVANAVSNGSSPGNIQKKDISSIQRLSTPAEEEKLGTNDARMQNDKEIQEKPTKQKGKDEKEDEKTVQPKNEAGKDEEKKPKEPEEMNKEEKEKKKSGMVQKKQDVGAGAPSQQLSSKIEASAGKGKSLEPETLGKMNSSFGSDFNDVKIHNDADAENMNKELSAQAFTHGKDIYFNKGKYDPDSKDGEKLIAHELTHVVQQNAK
jgi:hypothetical protein